MFYLKFLIPGPVELHFISGPIKNQHQCLREYLEKNYDFLAYCIQSVRYIGLNVKQQSILTQIVIIIFQITPSCLLQGTFRAHLVQPAQRRSSDSRLLKALYSRV